MENERLHSFDALRSFLLLIGVYFHLASMYTQPNILEKYDISNQHWIFNLYMSFQSYFRMPAFFLIAGFFGAFLVQKKGLKEMMINRFKRILLPLLIFIFPISIFYKFIQSGTEKFLSGMGIMDTILDSLKIFTSFDYLLPNQTLHLWFLNYLFFLSMFAFLCIRLNVKVPYKNKISILFERPWIGTILFCFAYGLFMVFLNKNKHGSPNDFNWLWFLHLDGIKSFIVYSFFYFIGWIIFDKKHMINYLSLKKQLSIFFVINILIVAVIYYLYTIYQYSPITDINFLFDHSANKKFVGDPLKKSLIDSAFIFLFNFAVPTYLMLLLSFFTNFFNNESRILRYFSDASYWIYIIHVLFTLTVPAIFYSFKISVLLKFSFAAVLSTILCLISYHLFARKTVIGQLLNGRKYK